MRWEWLGAGRRWRLTLAEPVQSAVCCAGCFLVCLSADLAAPRAAFAAVRLRVCADADGSTSSRSSATAPGTGGGRSIAEQG